MEGETIMMFSKDIGIDLGTANVLIYVKGQGIVLNQPSVVSMDSKTNQIVAVGEEAKKMIGRTPQNIVVVRPLKEGVIADFDVTEAMLKHFIHILKVRGFMTKPKIVICCPTNVTSIEQKAIREVAEKAGARKVYVEVEPKVAAIGAGMDIFQPSANMVIDIGGGTTDIAVLSMGDIVVSETIKVAGDVFDFHILQYMKKQYKVLIGEQTAENIKITIGTLMADSSKEKMAVRGRDIVTGLPRTVSIEAAEIEQALKESVKMIIASAKSVLEKTPPELSADIVDRGIFLTGGGAMIHGLDTLLAAELKVPVFISEDPLNCVVRGTGILLESTSKISRKK